MDEGTEIKNVYSYNEMLNLYIDKKLWWGFGTSYLIHKLDDGQLRTVIRNSSGVHPDSIYQRARAKDWLIILNLEKESRNDATEKIMES